MPRYKVSMHQTGWQTIVNFIDAQDEDEAWENYNKHGDGELVNDEWKVIDEEYRHVDTEITKEGDTPTEEVKKWREKRYKYG